MDLNSIVEKLPDVFFDWYARLIPGITGIILYTIWAKAEQAAYIVEHAGVFVMVAYVIGHFVQPISAFFVKAGEDSEGKEQIFTNYKQRSEKDTALIQLVTKAHAEAISMFSTAVIAIGLFFYFGGLLRQTESGFLVLLFFLLLLLTRERISARTRKIMDLLPMALHPASQPAIPVRTVSRE